MSATGPDPQRAAYLGWTGHRNMGDEAIMEALARALPGVQLTPVPVGPVAVARAWASSQRTRWHDQHLLLGGGTVLGRRIWRLHIHAALTLARRRPALMVGAGVEDPSFVRAHWLSERGELARWARVLRRFDRVTVRGPRSSELLADIGVEAEVVGDPALLNEFGARGPVEPGLVGVNLGCGDDLWGHDQSAVTTTVARTLARLATTMGWRFRFLVANPADANEHLACASQAGLDPAAVELIDAHEPQRFAAAAASCEMVLCQRLHAGIVGARVGAPIVMLEYQPKCRDFMGSIDALNRSIRTDRVVVDELQDLMISVARHADEIRVHQDQAVGALRSRLSEAMQRVESVLAC